MTSVFLELFNAEKLTLPLGADNNFAKTIDELSADVAELADYLGEEHITYSYNYPFNYDPGKDNKGKAKPHDPKAKIISINLPEINGKSEVISIRTNRKDMVGEAYKFLYFVEEKDKDGHIEAGASSIQFNIVAFGEESLRTHLRNSFVERGLLDNGAKPLGFKIE